MLVGESIQVEDLLSQARALRLDMILLDWDLPGWPAGRLLAALHEIEPQVKVIVLSHEPEAEESVLDAGADVFVSKANGPEELLAAFHRLAGWQRGCSKPRAGQGESDAERPVYLHSTLEWGSSKA
jgi:DNA-binding NarL/FixJ family response regulator